MRRLCSIALALGVVSCDKLDSLVGGDEAVAKKDAHDGEPLSSAEPGPPTFERRHGGIWMDEAFALATVGDGGYILAGNSEKVDNRYKGDYDLYVVRTGPDGGALWSARAGELQIPDTAFGVAARPDGGCVVVGLTGSKSERRLAAARFDREGKTVWFKTFGEQGIARANAIVPRSGGDYLLVGYAEEDLGVWTLGSDGTLKLVARHGGERRDLGMAAVLVDDGYIVAGVTSSTGAGKSDAWAIRFREDKVVWEKTYGGAGHDAAYAIAQSGDQFVLAGKAGSAGWIAWVDGEGELLAEQTVDTGGEFRAVAVGSELILAGGWTKREGLRDAWAVGFDAKREIKTDRTFGYNRRVINAARSVAGGGFVVAGNWASQNSNYSNFWICKLAPDLSGCDS